MVQYIAKCFSYPIAIRIRVMDMDRWMMQYAQYSLFHFNIKYKIIFITYGCTEEFIYDLSGTFCFIVKY